jgi:GNAT superfamily N-acetyltransferase
MAPEILADRSLSCRLERAEGLTNADFVEARARLTPESGARWISVAGALAMFDGADSPWSQTFGLGLFQMPTAGELMTIEDFFKERGARVFHEVSPWDASWRPPRGTYFFLQNWMGKLSGQEGCLFTIGVALFAGASTIPAWRRRGVQRALLEARFQYARAAGCDLAMMGAEPGSSSQRSAERQGFRIAYTRTKWTLAG